MAEGASSAGVSNWWPAGCSEVARDPVAKKYLKYDIIY